MQSTTKVRAVRQHLRLDRNEPTGHADSIGSYPNGEPLTRLLAARLGVPADKILLTAGADQALDVVCRAARGAVVMLTPDFVRYQQHADNSGLLIAKVPVPIDGSEFPLDAILNALDGADLLIVSTIANPTGCTPPADFIEIVRRQYPSVTILCDEVYAEFAPVHFAATASSTPEVISIGSLSKIAGPGLRVGFIVAEPSTLARLKPFVSPAAVSALSIDASVRLLSNPPALREIVRRQIDARVWLASQLCARGFNPVREAGNWVLACVGSGAHRLAQELAVRGIAVNEPPYPELADWLRISTPDRHDVEVFVDVLDDILDGPVVSVDGQLEIREAFRDPEAWVDASFVMRDGADVVQVDHVAITVPDHAAHLDFVSKLVAAGATLAEGPGVWPGDFCDDLSDFPVDLHMNFATLEVSPQGLLVVAAATHPNDQLSRFRSLRGPWGVHHVAVRVTDVHAAAGRWREKGWTAMSKAPAMDGGLHQWFLRNEDGQIIELIARRAEGRATFTCENLKALRLAEER